MAQKYPSVGDTFKRKDHIYTVTHLNRHYENRQGEIVPLWTLRGTCAECGASYEARAGRGAVRTGELRRRCDRCKGGGTRGVKPWPISKAEKSLLLSTRRRRARELWEQRKEKQLRLARMREESKRLLPPAPVLVVPRLSAEMLTVSARSDADLADMID